ncbi:hypothetical protein GCM10009642_28240 [Nocardiopsis metallicus]
MRDGWLRGSREYLWPDPAILGVNQVAFWGVHTDVYVANWTPSTVWFWSHSRSAEVGWEAEWKRYYRCPNPWRRYGVNTLWDGQYHHVQH